MATIKFTISEAALNQGTVSISGNGYTLALASGVNAPKTTAEGWSLSGNIATYKTAYTSAGYKLDGGKIVYSKANGGSILVTVTGVKSTSELSLNGKVVTISEAALGTSNVSISKGYTFALAKNVVTAKKSISEWTTLKNGNVAYFTDGTTAYYSLNKAKTTLTYTAAKAGTNKLELSGVKGTPTLSGKTVKLTASNFKSNVSVKSNTGSYTFSLSGNFKNKTFTSNSGADTIQSSNSNETNGKEGGSFTKSKFSSGDLTLTIKGGGTVVFDGVSKNDKFNINGKSYSIIFGAFFLNGDKIFHKKILKSMCHKFNFVL